MPRSFLVRTCCSRRHATAEKANIPDIGELKPAEYQDASWATFVNKLPIDCTIRSNYEAKTNISPLAISINGLYTFKYLNLQYVIFCTIICIPNFLLQCLVLIKPPLNISYILRFATDFECILYRAIRISTALNAVKRSLYVRLFVVRMSITRRYEYECRI